MSRSSMMKRGGIFAWIIFAVGVLYYCFAYLLRVYPSVMVDHLQGYFAISANGLGLLTAFYYFAYAPMQIPVGVSVDRLGPRRSLLLACIIVLLGATLFAVSSYYSLALLGRFLIGFGAAFAYVTALKLASCWLPLRFFATATGMVTALGMVAAIFTDMYFTRVVANSGFKTAMDYPSLIAVSLFILIFLVVRDKPDDEKQQLIEHEKHALSFKQLLIQLRKIIKSRQMWLIGLVGALLYLPASVFLDVWAIPYLKSVHHLTPHQAALGVSIMLSGWIISSFGTGIISDIFRTRKIPLVFSAILAALFASVILYASPLSTYLLYTLMFFFGLSCGPHPLCFTLSKENNSHEIAGTAVSFANFIIMMGGFLFQPIVGVILDWLWSGALENGIKIYTNEQYVIALSIIPIGLVLAGVLTAFVKETAGLHKVEKTTPSLAEAEPELSLN